MDRAFQKWLPAAHPPEKMLFLAGPRQVGKTTLARRAIAENPAGGRYLNFDVPADRRLILAGEDFPAALRRPGTRPLVVLDEIHKMRRFKGWLKGFYDANRDDLALWATGSGRLDLYQKGGDSLLGRYFLYRLHPLSVGELAAPGRGARPPDPDEAWRAFAAGGADAPDLAELLRHGGFPEPFLRQDDSFHRRWVRSRRAQVTHEDLRDLTRIQDLDRLEQLVSLLAPRIGSPLSLNSLREDLELAFDTVRSWMSALERIYYVFGVRPWDRRLQRSLKQMRKFYYWDWSEAAPGGGRFENFVLSHFQKAVQAWTDFACGDFALWYVRDKEGREADVLLTRDNKPWLLAETKETQQEVAPALRRFADLLDVERVVQLVAAPGVRRRARAGKRLIHVASAGALLRWLP